MKRIMQYKKVLLYLVFVLPFTNLCGQSHDTELWTGGTFKLKLNKSFRIELEEQARFNNNVSAFKNIFTEVGIRYRINKYFALKTNYRYTIRPLNDNRNRVSIDANYTWTKKKFPLDINCRVRFQDTKENTTSENTVSRKFTYLRGKLGLDYNLSKLVDPFVSSEIFFRFNKKNEFREWRITAGLTWRISKSIDLDTFYRYQAEMNVKNPETANILGAMITYSTKIKKQKKPIN